MGPTNAITVVQSNLHHCKAASAVLCKHIAMGRANLALIQEPWVCNNKVRGLNLRGFNAIVGCSVGRPRTCIVADLSLNALFLPQFSSADLTAIQLTRRLGGPT